jgi:uncharacterized protein involved in type VI secretion and phage assembly
MPTVKINQIAPEFHVNGTPLAATWWAALISMRIERELNVVGRTVLRFADVGYQLSASTIFSISSKVKISAYQGGPLFEGIVTGANLEQVAGEHPELVITVDDNACKLGLDTKVVAHVNKSYDDILNAIVGATGLTASISLGASGGASREYVLQRSTDLAFLDTIVRRANCMWWVDGQTFMVTKAAEVAGPALAVELGTDVLDFSVRASGLRPTKVAVNGWDAEAQADIVSPGDKPASTASSTFADEYTGTKGGMGVNGQQTAGDGNPNDSAEAQALASSLATAWHSAAVVARGTAFVNPAIAPATKIHVTNAGPSSGDYTVTAVEHVYNRTGFFTKFVAGPVRPSGLVDTLGNEGPDTGFAMTGLITGMVSDADDPNGQGRVKVNYTGAGGSLVSNWARVVSLGGGAERGTVFIPEVNDEVLVGFERGDSRHPVVIGGLFSQKTKIAADGSLTGNGKIAYRRITSRLGHVVELADGSGQTEQHIKLQLGSPDHKLRLGADRFDIEVTDGTPLLIKAGSAKFEIDNQGNITIEGKSIKLKAQMDIGIETSGGKFTAKGTTGVEVSGMKIDVKADTTANIEGNAMTTIKGGQVMIN